MNTHRNNPDSDEMQQADHENRRAAFTAKMEALHEANEPTTPSAEPTPETDAETSHRNDAYEYVNPPCWEWVVPSDFARRLERERDEARRDALKWKGEAAGFQAQAKRHLDLWDEARAELAKRSGDSHIDAPPTEGSAVEWVKERLFTQWDDDGNAQWYLCKTDARILAAEVERLREQNKRQGIDLCAFAGEVAELRAQADAVCEWTLDSDDECWDTQCDVYSFNVEFRTPKFCPGCGRTVKIQTNDQ